MFHASDSVYATMDPDQAAEAVQVLDLHARWETLRDTPAVDPRTAAGRLRELQKAFEAYRSRMAEYVARYSGGKVPELSPAGPDRLAIWCRAVAAVVRRSGVAGCPAGVVAKAYRMADRIAFRVRVSSPVLEEGAAVEAGRELDAVVRWCEALIEAGTNQEGVGQHSPALPHPSGGA